MHSVLATQSVTRIIGYIDNVLRTPCRLHCYFFCQDTAASTLLCHMGYRLQDSPFSSIAIGQQAGRCAIAFIDTGMHKTHSASDTPLVTDEKTIWQACLSHPLFTPLATLIVAPFSQAGDRQPHCYWWAHLTDQQKKKHAPIYWVYTATQHTPLPDALFSHLNQVANTHVPGIYWPASPNKQLHRDSYHHAYQMWHATLTSAFPPPKQSDTANKTETAEAMRAFLQQLAVLENSIYQHSVHFLSPYHTQWQGVYFLKIHSLHAAPFINTLLTHWDNVSPVLYQTPPLPHVPVVPPTEKNHTHFTFHNSKRLGWLSTTGRNGIGNTRVDCGETYFARPSPRPVPWGMLCFLLISLIALYHTLSQYNQNEALLLQGPLRTLSTHVSQYQARPSSPSDIFAHLKAHKKITALLSPSSTWTAVRRKWGGSPVFQWEQEAKTAYLHTLNHRFLPYLLQSILLALQAPEYQPNPQHLFTLYTYFLLTHPAQINTDTQYFVLGWFDQYWHTHPHFHDKRIAFSCLKDWLHAMQIPENRRTHILAPRPSQETRYMTNQHTHSLTRPLSEKAVLLLDPMIFSLSHYAPEYAHFPKEKTWPIKKMGLPLHTDQTGIPLTYTAYWRKKAYTTLLPYAVHFIEDTTRREPISDPTSPLLPLAQHHYLTRYRQVWATWLSALHFHPLNRQDAILDRLQLWSNKQSRWYALLTDIHQHIAPLGQYGRIPPFNTQVSAHFQPILQAIHALTVHPPFRILAVKTQLTPIMTVDPTVSLTDLDKKILAFTKKRMQMHPLNDALHHLYIQTRDASPSNPIVYAQHQLATDIWRLLLATSLEQLNRQWQQSITPYYQSRLAHAYPMEKNAKKEATPHDISVFFGPSGTLNKFILNNISPFLHLPPHRRPTLLHQPLKPKIVENQYLLLSPHTRQALSTALYIQHALFPQGKPRLQHQFSLQPVIASPNVQYARFTYRKQHRHYTNKPKQHDRPIQLQWPTRTPSPLAIDFYAHALTPPPYGCALGRTGILEPLTLTFKLSTYPYRFTPHK